MYNPLRFLFANKKDNPVAQHELGATGSVIFGGVLYDKDYNSDLEGDKGLTIYDEMRKSDGQVRAALSACELPLRAAQWEIVPASTSDLDLEVAEHIRKNLFDDLECSFDEFLRHVLLCLPFGYSVFEKVYVLENGKYYWKKFAPRLPKSINEIHVDPNGNLVKVQQLVTKDDVTDFIDIPAEKVLIFTLGKEGSNFRGESIIRAAYKHWYYKNMLYRIDGMAAERHGMGIPVFTYPTYAGSSKQSDLNAMGQRLQANAKNYVALPTDYTFDLKGVQGQLHDIMRSIDHHDMQIVRSILAQFLNLGGKEVGSYALSQDQSSFFLMALQAVGRTITDTFNRCAIRQLVDYNYTVTAYPKLQLSGIEVKNIAEWALATSQLATAGALTMDEDIEREVRKVLRLPALTKETAERRPENQEEPVEEPEEVPSEPEEPIEQSQDTTVGNLAEHHCDCAPRACLAEKTDERPLSHARMLALNAKMDKTADKILSEMDAVQKRQVNNLVTEAMKHIKKRDAEGLGQIDIRYKGEMAAAITKPLMELYKEGRKDLVEELKVSAVELAELDRNAFLGIRAKVLTATMASRLKAAAMWAGLNQIVSGTPDQAALTATLTALSNREARKLVNSSVSQAYNLGRRQEAKRHDVTRVIRQAVDDSTTCGSCLALNGRTWAFDDRDWENYDPPDDARCDGRDRCRCVLVFVRE